MPFTGSHKARADSDTSGAIDRVRRAVVGIDRGGVLQL
jgi:hypothetical protein